MWFVPKYVRECQCSLLHIIPLHQYKSITQSLNVAVCRLQIIHNWFLHTVSSVITQNKTLFVYLTSRSREPSCPWWSRPTPCPSTSRGTHSRAAGLLSWVIYNLHDRSFHFNGVLVTKLPSGFTMGYNVIKVDHNSTNKKGVSSAVGQ